MKKIYSLLKNEYIYAIITRFLSLTMSMLQSIIVARYLGASLQGINTYILSIVSIGSIVITFGMHQAYPYFKKKYGKDVIYKDFVSTVMFLYLMYFIIACFLCIVYFDTIEVRAATILIPIYGYSSTVAYVTLVEAPNKRNMWWTIICVLDILFVIVLFLFVKKNIYVGISILLFAEILKGFIYTIVLKTRPVFHRGLFRFAAKLFKFGFFPMIALLMTTLNYKIDVLMLRHFDFITAAQIGVYSIGMQFADKVVLIPDTLMGVLVSKLSRGADEREVAKVARLCFWASTFICVVFFMIGEPMLNLLYGIEYDGAYDVLMICGAGSIFVGYFKLIAQYNIVNKKQIRNVTLLSISIIVNAVLNLVMIPRFQLRGAAFASGVGYFLSGIIFVIWFCKTNKMPISQMFNVQKKDIEFLKQKIS